MQFKTITLFAAMTMLVACGKGDGNKDEATANKKAPAAKTPTAKPPVAKPPVAKPPVAKAPTGPSKHELAKEGLGGDPVAGEKVYKKVCFACHGNDGRGNGGLTGADLVKEKVVRLGKLNSELFTSVSEGVTGGKIPMPPQKALLNPQQIKDAIAYIRHKFGGEK